MTGIGLILLLASTTTAPAASQPATAPSAIATLRNQVMAGVHQRLDGLPLLGTYTRSQVLRLGLADHQITVHTDLPATKGQQRIIISDLPGVCMVAVERDQANESDHGPLRSIQFQRFDFGEPDIILRETSFSALPGRVSIACSWQRPLRSRVVQLIESVPLFIDPENPQLPEVSFYVQEFSGPEDQEQETIRLHLTAPDLPTLSRRHPREVDEYLRPALRQLGMESLVAVDQRVAWQVFADQWTPDPQITQKVKQLLPLLNSPDYRQREEATRQLQQLGVAGALTLLRVDREGLTEEQKTRIDSVIAAYQTLSAQEVKTLREDVGFLLDCLLIDDPKLRSAALRQLRIVTGRPIEFDEQADATLRSEQVAKLRGQLLAPPASQPIDPES
ncbi:MAG: hypothetical protein IT446_13380 [Phycisphaerales bacterium]|nr:hypothetical protein [Phycisphaerales bacterium]